MNSKKRCFSLLLCFALILTSLPLSGFAVSDAVLTVGSVSGLRGDTVEVPISVHQANGVAAGGFTISYDTSALTLLDAVAGELLSGTQCTINKAYSSNALRVSFAGTEAFNGDGALLTVTFRIKENAAFGESQLTATNVKLMDIRADAVGRTIENGAVTVLGASVSLTSASVMAGESTTLSLSLHEPVASCGCEITLHYDVTAVTAGKITGVQKLGTTPISFSSSVDREKGIIKLSFMAATPIDGFGELCSIRFSTEADAVGDSRIAFSKVRFVDANGDELAHLTPSDAVISISERLSFIPKIYFTNGTIDSENGLMTIYAAVNGASVACGGSARICYDPSSCALTELDAVYPGLVLSPNAAGSANGTVKLSWASPSPMTEEQILVSMTFQMTADSVSALTFDGVTLADVGGKAIATFNAYNGKVYDDSQNAQLLLFADNPRLERDYAQSVPVTVINLSEQSVHYYLKADNPYDDIYLNFVSCGSEVQPITILPEETQTIDMSVFLQNAQSEHYAIPVTAYVAYGDEFYTNVEYEVAFSCHIPNVNVSFLQGAVDTATLATEWRIRNTGEAITDLTLTLEGDAAHYAAFESGYENYSFASGAEIAVKLLPDLWKMKNDGIDKFAGKLTATGGGRSFSTNITFNTNGQEIICLEAYRMALFQEGNPYYMLEQTECSSSFSELTENTLDSFVESDGSFAISTQKTYQYSDGQNADVQVNISCRPSSGALPADSVTYFEERNDTVTEIVQITIGEEDYLELLSALFSDMGEVFDLKKQAREMAEMYLGVGEMQMTVAVKITDPLLKKLLETGGDLGEHIMFFLNAAQVTSKTLGYVSDTLDVASIWANPNISNEDKLAYLALGLAQTASTALSDPAGGWFGSGIATGFSLLNKKFRTHLGEGPLSQKSNEELGYYINSLVSGYQCTNAGRITSGATLTKGMCGFFSWMEVYRRLGDGTLNESNILQAFSTRSGAKSTAALLGEDAEATASGEKASLVWMTGRMASKDNSYVNQTATKFKVYVNGRYIGEVQNGGLTEMFCACLVTDAFVDGDNTITRVYNTNPGSHYVTAETEYSILVPAASEIAYIGSRADYSELRPLPDFAVYPENIYVDRPTGESVTAIVGDECDIRANIYNRGQRGGWVDVVFSCAGTELYRIENQYIGAFSSVGVSFPWVPDGSEEMISVALVNKTSGVEERRGTNNNASIPVTTRERVVPVIESITPEEIVIRTVGDAVYLTADVRKHKDVTSAGFTIDGGNDLPGVTSAQYGDLKRYTVKLNAADIELGEHTVGFAVSYQDGKELKTVSRTVPVTARFHDCSEDGHILLHHSAVEASLKTGGSIEYWYCDSCGLIFDDSDARHAISLAETYTEPKKPDISIIAATDAEVTICIRFPGALPPNTAVLVASYDEVGRMEHIFICSEPDLIDAESENGACVAIPRSEKMKIFLIDDRFTPLCGCFELNP